MASKRSLLSRSSALTCESDNSVRFGWVLVCEPISQPLEVSDCSIRSDITGWSRYFFSIRSDITKAVPVAPILSNSGRASEYTPTSPSSKVIESFPARVSHHQDSNGQIQPLFDEHQHSGFYVHKSLCMSRRFLTTTHHWLVRIVRIIAFAEKIALGVEAFRQSI